MQLKGLKRMEEELQWVKIFNLKIRTVYFKVKEMHQAANFWKEPLGIEPHKTFPKWHEFSKFH
jgi:catechol-2,3-dioxygenase